MINKLSVKYLLLLASTVPPSYKFTIISEVGVCTCVGVSVCGCGFQMLVNETETEVASFVYARKTGNAHIMVDLVVMMMMMIFPR